MRWFVARVFMVPPAVDEFHPVLVLVMAGGRISERYLDRYCVLPGTVQQTGSMQMLSLYLASILSVNQ